LAIKPANVSITDNDINDGGDGGTLSLTAIANQIFRIEGNPGQAQLLFSQIERDASFVNEIGVFVVSDDQGTITDPLTGNAIALGQAGYLQAALIAGSVSGNSTNAIYPQQRSGLRRQSDRSTSRSERGTTWWRVACAFYRC
jgi:hypothetical protein